MQENKTHQTPTSSDIPIKKGTKSKKKYVIGIACILLAGVFIALYVWQPLRARIHPHPLSKNPPTHSPALEKKVAEKTPEKIDEKTASIENQNTPKPSLEKQNNALLLEANYLVQLASFHLVFNHNTQLAQQLLEAADTRLATDSSPTFWPVRKAFAEDIAMLKAAPSVDLPGLVARIGSLMQQAEQVPLTPLLSDQNESVSSEPVLLDEKTTTSIRNAITADLPKESNILEKNEIPEIALPATQHIAIIDTAWNALKKAGKVAGEALSKMVIVSTGAPAPILLTAEQRLYLITNIQSQLNLAEWAAIHRQEKIYQQSLTQVEIWLSHYFPPNNPISSMLDTLEELKNISVQPETPEVTRSMDALKKITL